MAEKKLKSVYDDNGMNLQGDITVTLTAQERNMIANALTILSPKECDIGSYPYACQQGGDG